MRAGETVSKLKWECNLQNYPVVKLSASDPLAIYSMEQVTLASQGLSLLGFSLYATLFFHDWSMQILFYLCVKGPDSQMLFDFEQHKYLCLNIFIPIYLIFVSVTRSCIKKLVLSHLMHNGPQRALILSFIFDPPPFWHSPF